MILPPRIVGYAVHLVLGASLAGTRQQFVVVVVASTKSEVALVEVVEVSIGRPGGNNQEKILNLLIMETFSR